MHRDVTFVCPSVFVWVNSMTIVAPGTFSGEKTALDDAYALTFVARARQGSLFSRVFVGNASYARIERAVTSSF